MAPTCRFWFLSALMVSFVLGFIHTQTYTVAATSADVSISENLDEGSGGEDLDIGEGVEDGDDMEGDDMGYDENSPEMQDLMGELGSMANGGGMESYLKNMGGGPGTGDIYGILGIDEAELKKRMDEVFGLIDADKNDHLNADELKQWIRNVRTAVYEHHANNEAASLDKDGDGFVTLEELKLAYAPSDTDEQHHEDIVKRISIVDTDKDGQLNKVELMSILDPSRSEELLTFEATEILHSQDKDNDKTISMAEFLTAIGDELQEEEKDEFQKEFDQYDSDKDGKIDFKEIQQILRDPNLQEINSAFESTMKLLGEQQSLAKEEFLKRVVEFAQSELTDSGEMLRFPQQYASIKLSFSNTVPQSDAGSSKDAENSKEEL